MTTRPPTLLAMPSYLAGQLAKIGRRALAAALAEHDLRLPHFAALTALRDFGPLPQHELAECLGFNRSHLVGYLDTLQRHALVLRERDPADRRRQQVALTGAGRTLYAEIGRVADRSEKDMLAALTEAERKTLMRLMQRILSADDAGQSG